MRAFVVVLDSVGIGAAPDASAYGDVGSATLPHIAAAVGGLRLPTLQRMGLGNIPALTSPHLMIQGVPSVDFPVADFGAMRELSKGKDTTTGHWEMAGLALTTGFKIFPSREPSFPPSLLTEFERRTGRRVIGNRAASGTAIIAELGPQQMRDGCWIVYTSADSVFQIAAHEEIIPLDELYAGCKIARELCNRYHVGRVIARPYVGSPGAYVRTDNRRDFAMPPPEDTILDHLSRHGVSVATVGKLDDIFSGRGIQESFHVENNPDAQNALLELVRRPVSTSFIFANLIDFDMRFGHRRDPEGYAHALEETDQFLEVFLAAMDSSDLLILTADHGNDPTFKGTDHTREYVPLLSYRPHGSGRNLGIRQGFYDVAQTMAAFFHAPPMPRGTSFLG